MMPTFYLRSTYVPQVLVHVGAEEAIFAFSRAVLQPGDHVIVMWPCYQSLYECAASRGCYVSPWKVRGDPLTASWLVHAHTAESIVSLLAPSPVGGKR